MFVGNTLTGLGVSVWKYKTYEDKYLALKGQYELGDGTNQTCLKVTCIPSIKDNIIFSLLIIRMLISTLVHII